MADPIIGEPVTGHFSPRTTTTSRIMTGGGGGTHRGDFLAGALISRQVEGGRGEGGLVCAF